MARAGCHGSTGQECSVSANNSEVRCNDYAEKSNDREKGRSKAEQPMKKEPKQASDEWMWLSFAEPQKGFLGAAIVRGHDVSGCVDEAWRLGINPAGSEVMGQPIKVDNIPESFRERLLNREEAATLAKIRIQLRYPTVSGSDPANA
jgi:hypothetical protein